MSRYDDIDHLMLDLDNERRYKDQIELENNDLEKTIVELEAYLRHLDEVATTGTGEDSEWKARYETQKNLDIHLAEYKSWLDAELADTEWKLHTGHYPEAMNCNLDLLTELELIRLVKHMERMKADYYNNVRDTEYKAEKEMKEFHHLDEMRRSYKADLKHASQNLERMRMEDILERQQIGCTPPPYPLSPSYVRWLDSQSLDESSGLSRRKSSKSSDKSRKQSISKERRSSSKSPARSKSRSEKSKSKKKDDTAEEEVTATEGEGATDRAEDDAKGSHNIGCAEDDKK